MHPRSFKENYLLSANWASNFQKETKTNFFLRGGGGVVRYAFNECKNNPQRVECKNVSKIYVINKHGKLAK